MISNMVKKIIAFISIFIISLIFQSLGIINNIVYADNELKINSVNFDNSDSIIFLGTSGNNNELKITKKMLSEPDRIFFDIENAIITFPNSNYEFQNSKLKQIKIAQNSTEPDIVRIVIFSSENYNPAQIKVLKINNNIIIKLNNDIPQQKYLTQIYKESRGSSSEFYDKTIVIQEKNQKDEDKTTESDEIFNKVQAAFNERNDELVRPNIEQKQAKLKSRFFLDKVGTKDGNILISGIGVINIEKPFILTNPSRIVFDMPNTIVLQELRDKEFKLSEFEKIRVGQFEPSKARIVIYTENPTNYNAIYSDNLQSILIANKMKISNLQLSNTPAKLTYFKEQNINAITDVINIMFSNPIIYSLEHNDNYLNITLYNLTGFDLEAFNSVANVNKTGFKAQKVANTTYVLSFPVKGTTFADCYETLNAAQLRFVFTKSGEQVKKSTAIIQTTVKPAKKTKEKISISKIKKKVIIIDPGHGGADTGAMRGKILEKDLTLQIAKRVKNILEAKGLTKVILTREQDSTLSLSDRVELANSKKADIYVSIHINASVKTEINGIETHYYSESGYDVAKIIHKELLKNIQAENRGLFKSKFYVINHTEAPAVLLELGFISNEKERTELTSDERQQNSAQAIADGIINYLMEH